MKRWHVLLPNWAITVMLALIVALNLVSSYYDFSIVSRTMVLSIIPLMLLVYFFKQKVMVNVFFTIFLLFFLGIIFNVFDHFSLSSKLSESCFLGAYALLVFVMIGKLKDIKFEGLVSWYLIVILFINAYLMYNMFVSVEDSFRDSVNLTLIISKGIALLVMAFLAFAIYLSKESSQSIIFLTIVCCFVFSDVLSFITDMYIHFWLFDASQKILQSMGLFMFCMYVYNHQQLTSSVTQGKKSKLLSKSNQVTV